jgi:hypothetical protein
MPVAISVVSATNKKGVFQMSIRKAAMAALVAASMVAVPTIAQAAEPVAQKLSVTKNVRQGAAKVARKNDLAGGSVIIAVLAAAAVIAGIVIAADGNDAPASP